MAGRINRCAHCGCDEPILGLDNKLYCDNCGMSLEKLKGVPTMPENKMAQVAELFGKKLGERFTIIRGNKKLDARFMRYGFELMGAYENPYMDLDFFVLADLLTGEAKIMEEK